MPWLACFPTSWGAMSRRRMIPFPTDFWSILNTPVRRNFGALSFHRSCCREIIVRFRGGGAGSRSAGPSGRVPNFWKRPMSAMKTQNSLKSFGKVEEMAAESRTGAALAVALLHHPVYDKNRRVVATAVTNLDLHDIARTAKTFGLVRYYVVTPLEEQQELARRIARHW